MKTVARMPRTVPEAKMAKMRMTSLWQGLARMGAAADFAKTEVMGDLAFTTVDDRNPAAPI